MPEEELPLPPPIEPNSISELKPKQEPRAWLLVVAGVAAIIGIITTAYLFYQNQQLKKQAQQKLAPTVAPISTPTPTPEKFYCNSNEECILKEAPIGCCAGEPVFAPSCYHVDEEPLSRENLKCDPEWPCISVAIPTDCACKNGKCEGVFDETVGWQTYRSEERGYSFKYPPSWNVDDTPSGLVGIYNYDVEKAPGRAYDPNVDGDLFKIEIYFNPDYSDVDKWFDEYQKKASPVTGKPYDFLNVKETTVDGQKAIFYEIRGSSPLETLLGDTVFETPKGELLNFGGRLNYEGNKSFYDQILSTLKFLD